MSSPSTLTTEEITKLLAYAARPKRLLLPTPTEQRDHAMILTMIETGVRVNELVQQRIGDLIFQGLPVKSLIVRADTAKNHKERLIPVSPLLATTLAACTQTIWQNELAIPDRPAWRPQGAPRCISVRAVEEILRRLSLAALGRPVHPHELRHTFATRLMRVTSARVVQELLGHDDLRSTQIYTHPNHDDLTIAIERAARPAQEPTS